MLKKKRKSSVSSEVLAAAAVHALSAKQGENIVAYDVRKSSQITDFYVVVTGKNPPQMKAMANELKIQMKEKGSLCFKKAGDSESGWMVADYFNVVVHILSEEAREYYSLDELWQNEPRLNC